MDVETYDLRQIGQSEDGIVGSSGKTIKDKKAEGCSWSEVEDWVTRQLGYDKEVIDWARKIYNM